MSASGTPQPPLSLNAPIVFLDTETDGLGPNAQVWDIAMLLHEPDGGEAEVQLFVELDLSVADPFALRVGHFWERHPVGKYLSSQGDQAYAREMPSALAGSDELYSPREAAEIVAQMTHGATVCAAVPSFDARVLERLLRANGLSPQWSYHLLDVEAMALGYLLGRGEEVELPAWRYTHTLRQLGVELDPDDVAHTALGDARKVREVYRLITGQPAAELED